MSKKKKRLISICILLFLILGVIITLSFTVFALKKVEINFKTSYSKISLTKEDIIEKTEFNYGQSVFFHNKKQYIDKLESLDPYIDVINIETVFPSSFIVHIAQRQEVYAINFNNKFYITDYTLKVLKIEDNFNSNQDNEILISNIDIIEDDYQVGDYLKTNHYADLYSAFFACNRNLVEQKSLIKNIDFVVEYDDNINQNQLNCKMYLFGGQTVNIKNIVYGLKYKVSMFLQVYSNLYSLIGEKINSTDVSEDAVWTEELLNNCIIEINNFYNYNNYDETDCYFDVKVDNQ